jgi:genome maintenance exonuclease 1
VTEFHHVDHGFVLPDLKSETKRNGKRTYLTPNGDKYPSVTTVVNHEKNEFFREWNKDPKNRAINKKAVARGTIFHQLAEDYIKGKPSKTDNSTAKVLFNLIRHDINKINNVYVQEQSLYSDLLKLAGRVDLIAEYDGVLSVIDFKSAQHKRKEEWVQSYFLQATAYAIMWEELTGMVVPQIVLLIACEDIVKQIFKLPTVNHVKELKKVIETYSEKK